MRGDVARRHEHGGVGTESVCLCDEGTPLSTRTSMRGLRFGRSISLRAARIFRRTTFGIGAPFGKEPRISPSLIVVAIAYLPSVSKAARRSSRGAEVGCSSYGGSQVEDARRAKHHVEDDVRDEERVDVDHDGVCQVDRQARA